MKKLIFELALVTAVILTLLASPKNALPVNWWFSVFPEICQEAHPDSDADELIIRFRFLELFENLFKPADHVS